MAKQIILLGRTDVVAGQYPEYKYVLWASVPAELQTYYADVDFVSVYPDASQQETTDLRSGAVVEQVGYERLANLNLTPDEARDALIGVLKAHFDAFQTRINTFDPHENYGNYWDGTAWVLAG